MKGIGTIINVLAVLLGGSVGLLLRKRMQNNPKNGSTSKNGWIVSEYGSEKNLAKKMTISSLRGSSLPLSLSVSEPLLTDVIIADLSFVGNALIFCVGINLAFGKRFRVGNMLPALLFVVLFDWIKDWLPFL